MTNGLDIGEDQFMKLPLKQQNLILLRNTIHNRKTENSNKLNKKIQYVWLMVLTAALGFKRLIGY